MGRHSQDGRRSFQPPWRLVAVGVMLVTAVALGVWLSSRTESDLDPALATLSDVRCSPEGAAGGVTNGAADDATIVIQVEFVDEAGAFLQRGSVTRPGVPSGQSIGWAVTYRPDLAEDPEAIVADCEPSVPSMFRFSP